jgi:hypothetical protein
MAVRRLLGWPDPRQLAISSSIAILLGIYAWIALLPAFAPQSPRADDFQDYFFAARQLAQGGDPYSDFTRTHVLWDWSLNSGYIYPPAFAATLIPLTWLPGDLAVRTWLVLMQLAVLASLLIIYRRIGRPSRGELLCLLAVLTTFFPLISSALTGTMNAVVLLLLTGSWAAWLSRRDAASGVMAGVAAVFKLFPVALLPYLAWRRHWKLGAAMVVTGIVGIVAGIVVTGVDHNLYYYRDILPHLAGGSGYRENQSIAGITTRLCNPASADAGGGAGWCGRLLDWPLVLLLLSVLLAAVTRRSRPSLEFALAVAALPLVSSITWSFHLVVLVLPITLLIRQMFSGAVSRAGGRVLIASWICFSVLPAIHYLLIFHPLPHWPGMLDIVPLMLTHLASDAYFIGTLLIVGSLLVAVRPDHQVETATATPAIAA